ncbi:MAG: ribulose-phosphate 3-epimerase [Chromatiales bacterium]|nr:ribulose-phosphate 3-epimerase [Chromatiales bacterium]
MPDFQIAPSILSADIARLGEDVADVVAAGADLIHIDVMDNHYVPNLTFGPLVCKGLKKYGVEAPLDVHLMTTPVDPLIREFADAGAHYITFHPEATGHVDRSLRLASELGCKTGLAINPGTSLSCLDHVLELVDIILLMSVNPGFGGQTFIPHTLEKITQTRARIDGSKKPIRLEVDGGVNAKNIASIARAGADTFVAGSAIFSAPPYAHAIAELRSALANINQ